MVLLQNRYIRSTGSKVVNISNPLHAKISQIQESIERSSAVLRGYFLSDNNTLKEERGIIWDLEISPALKKIEEIAKELSPEEKRSIDALGLRLRELRYLQGELELYYEQHRSNVHWLKNNTPDSIKAIQEILLSEQEVRLHLENEIIHTLRPLKVEIKNMLAPLSTAQSASFSEDVAIIDQGISQANNILLLITGIFGGMTLFITILSLKNIQRSIAVPIQQLDTLAQGVINDEKVHCNNELQTIVQAGHTLKENIQKAITFATAVGKRQFDTPFEPSSPHDMLGNALIEMRELLKEAAIEEEKRSWSDRGLAHFTEVLRTSQEDLSVLCQNMINELVRFLNGIQGGIYLYTKDGQEEYLKLWASCGYSKANKNREVIHLDGHFAEGLIGQVYLTGETTYLDELPKDYSPIRSGLGESTPKSLLIIPMKVGETCKGIIEIASTFSLSQHEINFVQRLGNSLIHTLQGIQNAEKNKILLEESLKSRKLLATQEEITRKHVEKLSKTQEETRQRQEELESLQKDLEKEVRKRTQELENTLQRFHLATKGTSEGLWECILPIGIEINEMTVFWWSEQFKRLLGYENNQLEHELGSFLECLLPNERPLFTKELNAFIRQKDPSKQFTKEIYLHHKQGHMQWFRFIGAISILEDKKIQFAGLIKDLYAEKSLQANQDILANREAQLQSLLNNSSDRMMMLNKEFKIIMMNNAQKDAFKKQGLKIRERKSVLWETIPEHEHDSYKTIVEDTFMGIPHAKNITLGKGNSIQHFIVQFAPVYDRVNSIIGLSITSRDVTPYKQSQLQAEKALQKLQTVLDNYDAEVYIKDTTGKYLMADQTFCDRINKQQFEVIGKTDIDLFPEYLVKIIWESDQKVIQQKKAMTTQYISKSGQLYEFTKFPLFGEHGRVESVCSFGRQLEQDTTMKYPLSSSQTCIPGIIIERKRQSPDILKIKGGQLDLSDSLHTDEQCLQIPLEQYKLYQEALKTIDKAFQQKGNYTVKYQLPNKTHTPRLYMEQGIIIEQEDGSLSASAYLTDITALRPSSHHHNN
ncbi:hypothetical protein GCM10023331_40270 [Algivirga pacifica]|uniref:PAS domain S-box-containing protein n=2 Tax=Algivirga pacifica TaxID=1162670 RepID=A0ABP9DNL8_9BACT